MFAKMRKKRDNKGFTLVELIIVVAIIAVLAAVLAPRYMQYVEGARQSNDLQVGTSIMRAATAAVIDPANDSVDANAVYTITWTTTGTAEALTVSSSPSSTAANSQVLDSIAEVMGWIDADGYESTLVADAESAAGNSANFVFTIDVDTGIISLTSSAASWGSDGVGVEP